MNNEETRKEICMNELLLGINIRKAQLHIKLEKRQK